MEAVAFIKQRQRMCDYYYDEGCTRYGSCETCPAHDIDCGITANNAERLVAIVEQWAKEHPEEAAEIGRAHV